jgi:hypothetical protein
MIALCYRFLAAGHFNINVWGLYGNKVTILSWALSILKLLFIFILLFFVRPYIF